MPGLFSRRPKAKGTTQMGSSKGFPGAVSSADIDRLGLSSPTPSTADAHILPSVPTKDDLPAPPPKDSFPALQASLLNSSISRQTSTASQPSIQPSSRNMNESGQMQAAQRPSTISSYSNNIDKTHLNSASASTLIGARRPSPTLHTLPSNSHPGRQQLSSSVAYDASSSVIGAHTLRSGYTYGYTTEGWHAHLEAARVSTLLEACGEQIRNRGLDNPLIFSSMALDLSPTNVASLIKLFTTTSARQQRLPQPFLDEIRYANPHDLAAVIKWAFARMGRVLAVPVPVPGAKKGDVQEEMVYVQQRGFLDLEAYNAWREQERRQHYPATAFNDFLAHLGLENAKLLSSLFSLLSSTASYSLKNGMMPAKLSKHFGSLLFGLPEDETFSRTYDAYVRASNATEHLLLSYIRLQATTAALPPRLAQHVSGYPSILPAEITLPSASSKMVPITQIERNVRLYSTDLVQSACEMDLPSSCPEWSDCLTTTECLGKDPQLSDKFRKLVNLRGGAIQGRKFGRTQTANASSENEDDAVAAHGSLVSKRWDNFMTDGFAAPDSSKLTFDLNESARRNRGTKRETVQWNDFFKDGFRGEESDNLTDVLSFDNVLKADVQNWPNERDQLHAKLKRSQDKLPPFLYDTTPRLLTSPSLAGAPEGKGDNHPISRMDEMFADVWADYLLGSGWSNRDELTHRNANFVIVQYKSRPNASTVGSQSAGSSLSAPTSFRKYEGEMKEDRVDAAWFVVQEIVPAQYRADLEAVGRGGGRGKAMLRKLTMFSMRKDKEKSNVYSNGESKTVDYSDDVFRPGPGGSTKRILLSDQLKRVGSTNASRSSLKSLRSSLDKDGPRTAMFVEAGEDQESNGHAQFRSDGHQQQPSGNKLMSTFRAKSLRMVKSARRGASSAALKSHATATDELGAHTSSTVKSQAQQGDVLGDRSFTSADFETRSVATEESSETASIWSANRTPNQVQTGDRAQRQPGGGKEDVWIDILVKANGNRMVGQDAPATAIRKGSIGLPSSKAMDETAQLSVTDPEMTGASTPRTRQIPTPGSDETYEAHQSSAPRSSTPPLTASVKGMPETDHVEDLGLTRIASRSSNGEAVEPTPDASMHSDVLMRDGSLRDATPVKRVPVPVPVTNLTSPAPAIDPVAAARAALKSRKEAPPRAPSQIDTKKLVESLRAGLSPIEAVRASKEKSRSVSPSSLFKKDASLVDGVGDTSANSSATSMVSGEFGQIRLKSDGGEERKVGVRPKQYRDVFAKDPVAGRVADVASKFGGCTTAAASSSSAIPVLKGGENGKVQMDKQLPTSPVSASTNRNVQAEVGGVMEKEVFNNPSSTHGGTTGIGNAAMMMVLGDSMESARDADADVDIDEEEIYPEDAASNFDAKDAYQSSWSITDSPHRPHLVLPTDEAGEMMENLTSNKGMPLDNVLEESESVVSGSTNL
uniref:Rho gtpase-activating protein n=1 Tax=Melanopsichium pennsylvanicum 4 TaxID=1398559 RepID=A0A077RAP1_9BASI|nr:rho gtpase-activating protein [Melanopsichium pennsylvanicum 4]